MNYNKSLQEKLDNIKKLSHLLIEYADNHSTEKTQKIEQIKNLLYKSMKDS